MPRIFLFNFSLSRTHRIVCAVSCEDLFAEWLLSDGADGALLDIFSLLSTCEGEVLCHVCHAGASGLTALIWQLTRFFAVANMCCEDGLRAVMAEQVPPFVNAQLQPITDCCFRSSMPSIACFHCWSTAISRFDIFNVSWILLFLANWRSRRWCATSASPLQTQPATWRAGKDSWMCQVPQVIHLLFLSSVGSVMPA